LLIFSSCENNPGDVGLSFISPNDTTGVKYLDSQTDSITITSGSFRRPVNTYGAKNLLIGKYEQYESRSILLFGQIPAEYDSAVVNSATLNLKCNDYYYPNKTGNTAFNIYKVNQKLNLKTITADSITASAIGTTSLGFYTGVVPDSQTISLPIDNQTIKDWLEYAADTAYAQKNYGIMIQPSSASSTIRSFFSFNNPIDNIPFISVIVTKNGETDTLKLNFVETLSLTDAPASIVPQDRMLVQNGIGYRSSLTFDLSKLPPNVIINNATVQFTLDSKSSFISESGSRGMIVGLINDTTGYNDTLFVNSFPRDSIFYSVSINQAIQNVNSGNLPNLGVSIRGYFELQDIDKYVFYSPAVADSTKRPRLKIYYTIRN
jgi:hypothetical protein